jgi:hypothetical protein
VAPISFALQYYADALSVANVSKTAYHGLDLHQLCTAADDPGLTAGVSCHSPSTFPSTPSTRNATQRWHGGRCAMHTRAPIKSGIRALRGIGAAAAHLRANTVEMVATFVRTHAPPPPSGFVRFGVAPSVPPLPDVGKLRDRWFWHRNRRWFVSSVPEPLARRTKPNLQANSRRATTSTTSGRTGVSRSLGCR